MYKTRLFFGRISYPTYDLIQQLLDVFHQDSCTYYVIGFEGCNVGEHHEHIHFVCHFKNARYLKALQKEVGYNFRNEHPVKDVESAIEYCKGYEKSKLKCSHCSHDDELVDNVSRPCNVYFEMGKPPINGVHKTNISTKVIDALLSGSTPDKIREEYPAYYIHHSRKVKDFYKEITVSKKNNDRKLYVIFDDNRFEYASKHDSVFMDDDLSTYENEKCVISDGDNNTYWVNWINGYPSKLKRGYEVLSVDPSIVYLTVKNDRQLKMLKSIYKDKISTEYIDALL